MAVAIVFLAAFLGVALPAAEPRPTKPEELRVAMMRAHELRKKASGFNPAVAMRHALLMKSGAERCGHATVQLEKSGEPGAVYKLDERFKAAMDDGQQSVIVDYSGIFQLDAGLGLIAGECIYQFDSMKNDGSSQKTKHVARMRVKGGKLEWEATEQAEGDKEPVKLETTPIELHGVMPIPRGALVPFVALAASGRADFKPDAGEAWCLPVLDVDWELNNIVIEPDWVNLDVPRPPLSVIEPPRGAAMQMRLRSLVGDISPNGLEVETPTPEIWHNPQVWWLDEKFHPVKHPEPDDVRIHVEAIDFDKLDPNAPLDLGRIAAAMKAAVEKAERAEQPPAAKKKEK